MPKAVKKKLIKNPPKDPLEHKIRFKSKEKGVGLPCVDFKNRSTGRGNEDRSKPSPRFTSNNIHTKTRPKNLQEDGVENKLSASQVSS